MQKILTMLAALTIVGGFAMAQNEGNPDRGVSCETPVTEPGTPASTFEDLMSGYFDEAENPADFPELEREEGGELSGLKNLGQMLKVRCTTPAGR